MHRKIKLCQFLFSLNQLHNISLPISSVPAMEEGEKKSPFLFLSWFCSSVLLHKQLTMHSLHTMPTWPRAGSEQHLIGGEVT